MQFLDNRVRFLYPNFLMYIRRDPATILNIKRNILLFSKVMAIKYSMPYFQFCTEYSTATCNFRCQETLTVIYKYENLTGIVRFSVLSKCPPPAFTQARSLFRKLNMALLIEYCGSWSHINRRTFLSSSMFSGLG